MTVVEKQLVGDVWPIAHPGEDPVLYGSATISPEGAFEARSLQSFSLIYQVGRFGLDDTGSIKIVHRYSNDWGYLQTVDPADYNYVSATASNGSRLKLIYENGGEQRPWYRSLTVMVLGDGLYEGDTITIQFGDRSGGSPGLKLQTFCESGFEFKVIADVCATGHYVPIVDSPSISIIPGKPARWIAVLPGLRQPGVEFRLGIKAEDLWGNPTDQANEKIIIRASIPVAGLPDTFEYESGNRSVIFDNLVVQKEGVLRITLTDSKGTVLTQSNPLIVRDEKYSTYWGDMHGQSGETVGINTAQEYFYFAKQLAFLDATSHQANDFQINNAFWALINELTASYQKDHEFVTFPGYEWSGNTAVGGDRNVFFREEGRQIRRSSHALLPDRSDLDTDATSAAQLFEDLQNEDCVVYAHVGGRYADIKQAHDPTLESSMEIHSAWGTFEWLLTDGFELGHRSGVVCNSDGHKGRPGASYPGAASFGAYGGLTCFISDSLTRDGLFECLRRRHHYGTTGNRLHLDVRANFISPASLFTRDPRYFKIDPILTNQAIMGDIVKINEKSIRLDIECISQSPIERIDVLNGTNAINCLRSYSTGDLGQRIRIIWQGAEYRGRGRKTTWEGKAHFKNCKIRHLSSINGWNHERPTVLEDDQTVSWNTITTGNFGGFDVWLDESKDASVNIDTNHVTCQLNLSKIELDDIVLDGGGLDRKIRIFRLPERLPDREIKKSIEIPISPKGDNPVWIRVTTEDGFNAWSSPIFLYRNHPEPVL